MTNRYEHTQSSRFGPIVLGCAVVIALVLAVAAGSPTLVTILILVGLAVLTGFVVGVSRLTVEVQDDAVRAAFAWGWPPRTIPFDDIVAVRQVRNPWYYGYGIRKVPKGWMYNVWGPHAIELERSSGKVFRIGTDEPEQLGAALTSAMSDTTS